MPSVKKQQNISYELKIIDNSRNQYAGAREAFNKTLCELKGEYIMFVHNDFFFSKSDAFQKVIQYCKMLEPFGVLGVAGCGFEPTKLIQTRIKQGIDKQSVGKLIDRPIPAMSVDECCFIINKSQLKKLPFEDKKGWHLYAVEYCLQMLDCGLQNYVIPLEGWHYSDGGSLNAAYCKDMKGLLERYKNKYNYINTTVRQWRTDFFTRKVFLRYYAFKQNLKAILIKHRS